MGVLSCSVMFDPMDYIACQAPLSMEFSRHIHWSGLPFPTPGNLPDLRIEPSTLASLHWQMDSLPPALPGKAELKSILPKVKMGEEFR